MMSQPSLDAGSVVLRPWQVADVSAICDAYSSPDIQRWHVRSMTRGEAAQWIDSWPGRWAHETGAGWAIAEDSAVVGQVSLRSLSLENGVGEVSYWVVPAARGRHVATEALRTLCAWAFDQLGLQRVELCHSTLNAASCRVAGNAGFTFEGIKRREALHADGWHDMHLHSRLIDDPFPATSRRGASPSVAEQEG